MKRLSRIIILLSLLIFSFSPALLAKENVPVDLTILHVNDTHGRILPYIEGTSGDGQMVGGAAYLARMIEEERSKNPDGILLLSAGDMFQGTPVSNLFKGRSVTDVMNYLKFDAMAIGNHEFDWGMDVLRQLIGSSRFPYLSANIKDERGRYLPGVKPYIIVERKKVKIAIIGLTTPEVPYLTKPGRLKHITVDRPEDILPPLIKRAKDEGAVIIIVLSHLGLDADRDLAQRTADIHVIVGGHSHTALENAVVVGNTIIVQAGAYGLYLGVLKLKIDPDTGRIITHTEETELEKVMADKDRPYDKELATIIHAYYGRIEKEYSKVVGETSVPLVRYHQRESNIGNFICDTMRKNTGADMAFINSGAIRNNIPRGRITLEQVFTLLPFDNVLVTMKLTGKKILEILEQNAKLEHGILQVSGMVIRYDLSEPAGSRVREVYIGRRSLDPEKSYTVTTIDFLAAGGDAFSPFKGGKSITYGTALRDVLVSYLEKHSPISPRIEGRIIMNVPLNSLKFHDEGIAFPRISLSDLQPQLDGLFRLAGEEYEPLRNVAWHDGTTFEGPLFQVRPDLCLNIGITHPL
ncbi:MAG: 5'-nucleotidase C-terminal domain-containing protein [Syntrophales bacterium]|jgi:2',3'-cyclic-nucleotide 2'-phosphodiesterase (5'-nucleotidase family)